MTDNIVLENVEPVAKTTKKVVAKKVVKPILKGNGIEYVSAGVQVIRFAMTRLDYNVYRGWELPADENGEDAGFIVENLKAPSNHVEHRGAISWVTEEVFNATYSVKPEPVEELELNWLDRLEDEHYELGVKCTNLHTFMGTNDYVDLPSIKRVLLRNQYRHMEAYLLILAARIKEEK